MQYNNMNNCSTSVVCHLMLASAKELLAKLVSVPFPKTLRYLIQFLLICREDISALNLVMTSPLNFIDITITFNCQLGAHLTKQ